MMPLLQAGQLASEARGRVWSQGSTPIPQAIFGEEAVQAWGGGDGG